MGLTRHQEIRVHEQWAQQKKPQRKLRFEFPSSKVLCDLEEGVSVVVFEEGEQSEIAPGLSGPLLAYLNAAAASRVLFLQ